MDVRINENEITVPGEFMTWGDLLDWIETAYLEPGQCITHVYLDGNEAHNYRNRLFCGQELSSVGNVVIHSGNFDKVVYESLGELDQELKNTIESCAEIVSLFENRREEDACNRLAQLLDSIRIFFTVFAEDLGWVDPVEAEISREEFSAALERALTLLISAQENRYWVFVCDVLEGDITPILESWQELVGRTRAHIS